jgi:hypothetical protein
MAANVALRKNIEFWHWYPELLVQGLSAEQLRWQPEGHDTSITFAIWHAYRAADELVHGMVAGRPSVYAAQAWADRLPAPAAGVTPFGNGATREQIGGIGFEIDALLAYAKAVGEGIGAYMASLTDAEAAEEIKLPFFSGVYPGVDVMTRAETIAFFAIGHTSEHLGEVQFIKGLLGMKGAPL